jgi:magnesium transporter
LNYTIFSKKDRSFEWINLFQPAEDELKTMAENLNISQMYIQDILQSEHLPKVEQVGNENCYFLIARVLDQDLGGKDFKLMHEATRKLAIFFKEDQVITIERGTFSWLEEMTSKAGGDNSYSSAFQLVCRLLKQSFRSFEPLILRLGSDLDFYEGKLFDNEKFPPFAKSLYAIRRKAAILKRLFTVSTVLLDFLEDHAKSDPIAQDAIDMYRRIETMIEDVNERSVSLINLNLSVSSQRSNEVMRFLTIYSAFFMPLTFLVGVYGMNFQFMPEINWRWGYAFCWFLMIGMAGFHFWWFRRKNWL